MSKTREDEEPCYGGCGRAPKGSHPCPSDPVVECNCCKECTQDCQDAPFQD